MREIELPDGTIAEFPESMADAEIEAVLAKQFGAPDPASSAVPAPEESIDINIEELPEIGHSPELNELSFKGFKRGVAATFIADDRELAKALEANTPGSEVLQDPQGRYAIRMPSGQVYAVNKPGLSPQDFVQFISRALAFTPAGRGVAGIGVPALAKAAGQAALTETGLQAVEAQVGGEFTPSQPAIAAAAAPVGQVIGEKVVAPAVTKALQPKGVQDAVIRSAPSIQQLKKSASNIYDEIDEIGVRIKPSAFTKFTSGIESKLRKEGLDPDLTRDATAFVNRLRTEAGEDVTISKVDTLRKLAADVARSQNPSDARLGVIALDQIDDFIEGVGPQALIGTGRKDVAGMSVGEALKQARSNWSRARRAELIEQAFNVAEDQASGFENGLRVQFRSLLKRINTGKLKGFSRQEIDAMRTVSQGTTLANVSKQLGKLGIPEDQATNSLMLTLVGGLGGGAGFAAGGAPGAAVGVTAAIGIPTLFRRAATNITNQNAKLASAIIRSDDNAEKIIKAYIANTPKAQRNSSDMAALLFNSKADLSKFKEPGNKMINDAVWATRNLIITEATQERGDYGL